MNFVNGNNVNSLSLNSLLAFTESLFGQL